MLFVTLLSSVLSPYQTCSLIGAPTRFEGIGVILCYILVMLYTFFIIENAQDVKYLFYSLGLLLIFQTFIGLFQFIGYDPLSFKGIREIVSPGEFANQYYFTSGKEPFALYTGFGNWTGTLGNKNYSGSLVSLTFPIFLILTLFTPSKLQRCLGIFLCMAIFFITFACKSQGGQVGIFIALLIAIILFSKSLPTLWQKVKFLTLKESIYIGFYTLFFTSYMISVIYFTKGTGEIKHMFYSIGDYIGITQISPSSSTHAPYDLKDFILNPYKIEILTKDNKLQITFINSHISFTDKINHTVSTIQESPDTYRLDSKAFYPYLFQILPQKEHTFIFLMTGSIDNPKKHLAFTMSPSGELNILNPITLKPIAIEEPPTLGFKNHESLGSSRGYIWSRTLPLLKQYFLIGGGPDTFIFAFPQNDFLGKWQFMNNPFITVDKPHNTYLQIWVNQGFIALAIFLSINLIYLLQSLKLSGFKKVYTLSEGVGIALMLGITGYLVTSFFNDTTLSVTPLYYSLLGAGMAYNRIYSLKPFTFSKS